MKTGREGRLAHNTVFLRVIGRNGLFWFFRFFTPGGPRPLPLNQHPSLRFAGHCLTRCLSLSLVYVHVGRRRCCR